MQYIIRVTIFSLYYEYWHVLQSFYVAVIREIVPKCQMRVLPRPRVLDLAKVPSCSVSARSVNISIYRPYSNASVYENV